MSYQCVATSRAGFIQQLAVGYVTNGYYYYVTGVIPSNKPADKADCKILAAYDIAVSKWTRSRRKRAGQASVQYLRHGRFYVIIATDGVHPFFAAEAKRLRDIRRTPILFMGYPERFAQQALGHNSKAVHHAYSKHAEVTVPSLDDWEKGWEEKLKAETLKPEMPEVKVLPVDFRAGTEATQNRGATDALAVAQLN